MKRFVSILILLVFVVSIVACGGSNTSTSAEDVANVPEAKKASATPEPTIAPTPEPTLAPTPEPTPQAIFVIDYPEPVVIMDNEYVLVTILARYEDRSFINNSTPPFYHLGFKMYVENKTDNYYLSVGLQNVSIDSVMNDGFYGDTWVSPYSKTYPTMVFNRMVEDNGKHPNVETWEDIINVRGVCQLYFNTDGSKSGKGLAKAEFQFD